MLQSISLIQPVLISAEKPSCIGDSFNLIQIQSFQILSDGIVAAPVYIEGIESLGQSREIIPAAADGTDLGHLGIVPIHSHKSGCVSFYRDFKYNIRLFHSILRHSIGNIIHHHRYRPFSNSPVCQIRDPCKEILVGRNLLFRLLRFFLYLFFLLLFFLSAFFRLPGLFILDCLGIFLCFFFPAACGHSAGQDKKCQHPYDFFELHIHTPLCFI